MNRLIGKLLHAIGLCSLTEKAKVSRELEDARSRAWSLNALLQETNGRIWKQAQKSQKLRDEFAKLLTLSDDALESRAQYTVRKTEGNAQWEVVTAHCCLGGCDLGVYTFPTERDALLFAALLQAAGYCPSHNIACPACYVEYQKDCI